MFLPLWHQCAAYGYIKSCPDPFAPSGNCPAPAEAAAAPRQEHPPTQPLDLHPAYQHALSSDARFASIAERARRKLPVPDADFLYLRDQYLKDQIPGAQQNNCQDNREAGNESLVALAPLWNCLSVLLDHQYHDFVAYYKLEPNTVETTQYFVFRWAVEHTSPTILHDSRSLGYDWGSHLIEVMRLVLWANLVRGYKPIDTIPDPERFRCLFEAGWKELMAYRGAKFDFRVVPKLSPQALVRYQSLPGGDQFIRNTISSYIIHQATAYPHLTDMLVPGIQQHLYRGYLRPMFTPLVQSTASLVLDSLCKTKADRKHLKADVTKQVWQVFDEAVNSFRFHYPYSGKNATPAGLLGFLGLAESKAARESFDAFLHEFRTSGTVGGITPPDWMRLPQWMYPQGEGQPGQEAPVTSVTSEDLMHVLFTRYIVEHLKTWRSKYYPLQNDATGSSHRGGDPFPTLSLDAPDFPEEAVVTAAATTDDHDRARFAATEVPALVSEDGKQCFLSIRQVGRRLGVSEVQLRYLERNDLFHPRRAGEIAEEITQDSSTMDPGLQAAAKTLPAMFRLYPDTEESMAVLEAALLRVQTRSTAATLPGEVTRKIVAVHLSVPESQLRSWERSGKINPETRGRTVVYTPACIEQAQVLLASQAQSRKTSS